MSTWEATPLRPVPSSDTPEVVLGPDESRVTDDAISALTRAPEVYQRGNELVEVIAEDVVTRGIRRDGQVARVLRMQEARVRELLAREASILAPDGGGGHRVAHPPQWLVRTVMARGTWPGIRPLVAVASAPTMRPDGTILSRPGYDPSTGIYLASPLAVTVAEIPSQDDAARAVAVLCDVLEDFPTSLAAKSVWMAGVITVAVRHAIPGPVPMVIVDASVRGAGKSLMADLAAIITTGRPAARVIYSRDDAEVRKVITAIALVGDPLVLLDNVAGELGCPALDAALTADTWRDRVLGSSTMTTELPLRTVWYATGNGLIIGADLARRALLVRLEPPCERPEERTGWRYPRLIEHAGRHRATLLGAALTVARAYVAAGRPPMPLTPMGSYDGWSDLVRNALVWAGAADPCSTIAEVRAADVRTDALRAVVAAWPAADGEAVTAGELIEAATPGSPWRAALAEWCPTRGAEVPTPRVLGIALRGVRGRVIGAHTLGPAGRDLRGARWVRLAVGGTQ